MPLRALPVTLLAALFVFAGCDATAPSASADSSTYFIDGPSFVVAGDCSFYSVQTADDPQLGYNWTITGDGAIHQSSPGGAFVEGTDISSGTGSFTIKARAGSPSGPWVSKTVSVSMRHDGVTGC